MQRFSNAPEHHIIAILLVAIDQRIQFLRNGKYHMKIAYIQKIERLSSVDPTFLGKRLAFRAMPVTAGIIGWLFISTVRTFVHMSGSIDVRQF